MFERFTDRARRVVVLAQEEARLLGHNYIGTEHILLGLVREGEGVAARALEAMGVALEEMRAQVEDVIGMGAEEPRGHIPFTPRAKKVLELSLREALQLGHDYIGTEHILLGLVREGEGVGAQVLVRSGAHLERVRGAVISLLAERPDVEEQTISPRGTAVSALLRRAQAAAREAGRGSAEPLDLLAGMLDAGFVEVNEVLNEFGVDPSALRRRIVEKGGEEPADSAEE